jgi:hypothetical protein
MLAIPKEAKLVHKKLKSTHINPQNWRCFNRSNTTNIWVHETYKLWELYVHKMKWCEIKYMSAWNLIKLWELYVHKMKRCEIKYMSAWNLIKLWELYVHKMKWCEIKYMSAWNLIKLWELYVHKMKRCETKLIEFLCFIFIYITSQNTAKLHSNTPQNWRCFNGGNTSNTWAHET